jgi:hypothetical protein
MIIATAMATMAIPISRRFVPNKRGHLSSLRGEAASEGTRRGLRCLVEEHPLDTGVRVEEVHPRMPTVEPTREGDESLTIR